MAEDFTPSTGQKDQESKFAKGAKIWQTLGDNKKLWNDFAERVKKSGACDISLDYYMTGYQTFMSYYLLSASGTWNNYPLPPLT